MTSVNGERPWVFFDLEGTGVDPYVDRIVEMCFIVSEAPGDLRRFPPIRINPGRVMSDEVIAVHGITNEDVADLPGFDHYAAEIQEIVGGAILCGYNIRKYDTLLLDRELRMADQPGLERDGDGAIVQPEVDLFGMWSRLESRKLETAAKRFGGVDLNDAHSAAADAEVLPLVFDGMVDQFGLDGEDLDALTDLSKPEGAMDRDGKFVRREDGVVLFNFSKERGSPVSANLGLLEWMLNRDFSPETKAIAHELLMSGGSL